MYKHYRLPNNVSACYCILVRNHNSGNINQAAVYAALFLKLTYV